MKDKNIIGGIIKKSGLALAVFVVIAITVVVARTNEEGKTIERTTAVMTEQAFAQRLEEHLQSTIDDSARVVVNGDELEATISSSAKYPFLDGAIVLFKNEGSPEVLVKNLLSAITVQFPDNVALKKDLLIVDMRFGKKVFFGFEE